MKNNTDELLKERRVDLLITLSIIRLILVILLRAGVLLIQIGSIPTKNVYNILIQNIIDLCVTLTSYSLFGVTLFCGKSYFYGIIGFGVSLNGDINLNDAILGYSAIIVASSIVTLLCSGRLHVVATILSPMLFSGVALPVVMHMTWNDTGWSQYKQVIGQFVSFRDDGGATVHVTAALTGLIGALFLGRRILKLTDIDESSMGAESPGTTLLGYFLFLIGLLGLCLPRKLHTNVNLTRQILLPVINSLVAMTNAMLTTIAIQLTCQKQQFNYWNILNCFQGGIAGLVMVSAGVGCYSPHMCLVVGVIGGIHFYFISKCIFATPIEDYCHTLAIHLLGGFLSILLPPLLGSSEDIGYSLPIIGITANLLWQLGCIMLILILITPLFTFVFFLLWYINKLRNVDDGICHKRSLLVEHRLKINCTSRLFALFDHSIVMEPGLSGRTLHDVLTLPETENDKDISLPAANLSKADKEVNRKTIKKYAGKFDTTKVDRQTHNLQTIFDEKQRYLQECSTQKIVNMDPDCLIRGFRFIKPEIEELYTSHSNKMNKMHLLQEIINNSRAKGGGDSSLENSITTSNSYSGNMQRKKNQYSLSLHRTNKDTNLCRLKKDNRFRNYRPSYATKFNSTSSHYIMLTHSTLAIDQHYNDGFLTLKMPPQKKTV